MKPDRLTVSEPHVPAEFAETCAAGHRHGRAALLSRRRFLQGAVGATAVGAAVGSGLLSPLAAHAASPGIGLAQPIPSTLEFFPGVLSHVQAPPFSGPDSDPATVYNFKGASGLAYISGTVERRNTKSGEVRTLPFLFNDMRFMKGKFRGRDGGEREAAFAFI